LKVHSFSFIVSINSFCISSSLILFSLSWTPLW